MVQGKRAGSEQRDSTVLENVARHSAVPSGVCCAVYKYFMICWYLRLYRERLCAHRRQCCCQVSAVNASRDYGSWTSRAILGEISGKLSGTLADKVPSFYLYVGRHLRHFTFTQTQGLCSIPTMSFFKNIFKEVRIPSNGRLLKTTKSCAGGR